jgi:hypothetical protein
MQGAREMMMIDDVVTVLWAEDHRDHVLAEKPPDFFAASFAPAFALG